MKTIAFLTACIVIATNVITVKAPVPFEATTLEERAAMAGFEDDIDSFVLLSSVVEAESDRSQDLEGRIYISLVILNRASEEHPEFGDSVYEVLTAPGQFSTVRNGHSVVGRTDLSDRAVIEAVEWIEQGDAPDVLFFNCRGFFSWREPYNPDRDGDGIPDGAIGGNYFSL